MFHSPLVATRGCRDVLPLLAVVATIATLPSACVIDFDHLSDGRPAQGCAADASCADASDAARDSADARQDADGADVPDAEGQPDAPEEEAAADAGCPVLECASCSAVTLVSAPFVADPRAIAVTEHEVLWGNAGNDTLMRLPATGGDPILLATAKGLGAIAAADSKVVWADDAGLWACTQLDCGNTSKQLAASLQPGSIRQIAYWSMRVYWTDIATGINDGVVRSCLVDYCSSSSKDEALEDIRPYGIAVNATSLFWTMQGSEPGDSGFIYTCDKADCKETQVTDPVSRPTFIALSADNRVVWTERPIGDVARAYGCDYSSSQPCTRYDLAPGALSIDANDIALGTDRVYWTNPGPDTLTSCPLEGCGPAEQPKEHAVGRTDIRRLAVNAQCVFWTDGVNGGSIGKAPR